MTDWRIAFLAVMLALPACKEKVEAHDVPLPALLQQPAELPFGDSQMVEITYSTTAALDALEPRWGELGTRPFVVDARATGALRAQVRRSMPEGWRPVAVALPPGRGELIAYSSGKEVFGVLIAPVRGAAVVPVTVLASKD